MDLKKQAIEAEERHQQSLIRKHDAMRNLALAAVEANNAFADDPEFSAAFLDRVIRRRSHLVDRAS